VAPLLDVMGKVNLVSAKNHFPHHILDRENALIFPPHSETSQDFILAM